MENDREWIVVPSPDGIYVHILPKEDIKPHGRIIFTPTGDKEIMLGLYDCPCSPQLIWMRGQIGIIHKSFREQEAINESCNKIFKQ